MMHLNMHMYTASIYIYMLVATQRKRNADCAPFHRLALKVPSTEQLMYRPLDPLDQQHSLYSVVALSFSMVHSDVEHRCQGS